MQLVIKSKKTSNLHTHTHTHTQNANRKATATDSTLCFINKTAHLQNAKIQTSIYAIKTETTSSETVVCSTEALQFAEKERKIGFCPSSIQNDANYNTTAYATLRDNQMICCTHTTNTPTHTHTHSRVHNNFYSLHSNGTQKSKVSSTTE